MGKPVCDVTISAVCFGVCRNSQGTLDTDKLFTGQRLDDTGLYYYNARYYDATIGRFISADTIVPDYMNPQSLNRYSYCVNNPLKYVDPSGHANILDVIKGEAEVSDLFPKGGTSYGNGWQPVYDANDNIIPGQVRWNPGSENIAPVFDSEGHIVPGGFYNLDTGELNLPYKEPSWWDRNGKWVIVGVLGAACLVTGALAIYGGAVMIGAGLGEISAAGGSLITLYSGIETVSWGAWVTFMGGTVAVGGTGAIIYYGGIKDGLSTSGDLYPTFDSSVSLVNSYSLYQQSIIRQNMEVSFAESLQGVDYNSPYSPPYYIR